MTMNDFDVWLNQTKTILSRLYAERDELTAKLADIQGQLQGLSSYRGLLERYKEF